MTSKNSTEIVENKNWVVKIFIGFCVLIIIGALLAGIISLYNDNYFAVTEDISKVENIFVDVNGDGLQDYIRYGEVVINPGNLAVSP